MNQILTFVDLTRTASRAVDQAVSIALLHGSHIIICHILPDDSMESEPAVREKMQVYVHQLEGRSVSFELCIGKGDLYEEAHATVKRIHPSLVVAGTHGAEGVDLGNFGSAIHRLVRNVDVPTLVIGDTCKPVEGGFRKVLIPAGSQINFLAGVQKTVELMDSHGEIILYAIVSADQPLSQKAVRNMDAARDFLDTRGISWHYEEEKSAEHAVGYAGQTLEYMKRSGVELVVIPAEVTRQNVLFGKLDKEAMLLNEDGIQVLCVNGKV